MFPCITIPFQVSNVTVWAGWTLSSLNPQCLANRFKHCGGFDIGRGDIADTYAPPKHVARDEVMAPNIR